MAGIVSPPPPRSDCEAHGPAGSGRRSWPATGLWAVWLTLAAAGAATCDPVTAALERGDEAWQRRALGRRDLEADPGPIAEAVAAYREALAAAPGAPAIRERLLKALYFQGRFATQGTEERLAVYAQARELAEEGLDRLGLELGGRERLDAMAPEEVAAAVGGRSDAAALFFWAAAHWGLWGEQTGKLVAARRGVAGKVRTYAGMAARIDPRYEAGGGHRILGRLHTEAPRIPLITGWIDRDHAVELLEHAVELGSDEPLNRLYLADALLRFRPRRRAEALAMLEQLVAGRPRPDSLLEDELTLREARALRSREIRR